MRLAALLFVTVLVAGCSGDGGEMVPPGEDGALAFASKRGDDFDIYVMRPDGSRVRQLTNSPTADEGAPVWSPDGKWIAYMSDVDGSNDGAVAQDVFVMAADGSRRKRLTDNALAELVSGWTAGGEIVFWRCQKGVAACELRLIEPDGSGERRVFETKDAIWSSTGPHDGDVYALILDREATSFDDIERVAIDVDTGAAEPAREGIPSPEGGQRLIETDHDEHGSCLFHDCTGHANEIYVDDRRLTNTTGEEAFARWSPRGERIVFARIASSRDDYELWVMNADGSCETQLTDNADWDWAPSWFGTSDADARLDC